MVTKVTVFFKTKNRNKNIIILDPSLFVSTSYAVQHRTRTKTALREIHYFRTRFAYDSLISGCKWKANEVSTAVALICHFATQISDLHSVMSQGRQRRVTRMTCQRYLSTDWLVSFTCADVYGSVNGKIKVKLSQSMHIWGLQAWLCSFLTSALGGVVINYTNASDKAFVIHRTALRDTRTPG
jgi:hypothetical protein